MAIQVLPGHRSYLHAIVANGRSIMVGCSLLCGVPLTLVAQQKVTITQEQLGRNGVKQTGGDIGKNSLRLSPSDIVVDPKTHTVTVQVEDTSASPVKVTFAVQYGVPRAHPPRPLASALVAGDSLVADSLRRDSLRTDSLARHWSLASWVTDVPKTVRLKPGEKKTLTLHLDVPAHLPPGTYSAHLLAWSSNAASFKMGGLTGPTGQPMTLAWGIDLGVNKKYQAPVVSTITYQAGH